jgi:hypothetical protein
MYIVQYMRENGSYHCTIRFLDTVPIFCSVNYHTCVVLQDNRLEAIPTNLFKLPLLSILDVANNKLQTVPFALWTCTRFDPDMIA